MQEIEFQTKSLAIETVVIACRKMQMSVRKQPNRYWAVGYLEKTYGWTGFALALSDDAKTPHRKVGAAPLAPGFALVDPSNFDTGPKMNLEPFQSFVAAPRVAWTSVGLMVVPTVELLANKERIQAVRETGALIVVDRTTGDGPVADDDVADIVLNTDEEGVCTAYTMDDGLADMIRSTCEDL